MKSTIKIILAGIFGKFVFLPLLHENQEALDYLYIFFRDLVNHIPF